MPTIFPKILATTALCLAAVAVAPLHAECSLAYLQPEQAQEVIDIYRHTPELSEEYESRCNWVFVPMLYHEITPDCYLLCVEVGSGAIIYSFSLVKKQSEGDWLLLNHSIMCPDEPGHDLRCKLENDRYLIEIQCGREWRTVFSGRFSQPPRTYQYLPACEAPKAGLERAPSFIHRLQVAFYPLASDVSF